MLHFKAAPNAPNSLSLPRPRWPAHIACSAPSGPLARFWGPYLQGQREEEGAREESETPIISFPSPSLSPILLNPRRRRDPAVYSQLIITFKLSCLRVSTCSYSTKPSVAVGPYNRLFPVREGSALAAIASQPLPYRYAERIYMPFLA